MAKRGAGTRAAAGVIVDTVAGVVVDAKGVVTPVSGKVARQLHKIEKMTSQRGREETTRPRIDVPFELDSYLSLADTYI